MVACSIATTAANVPDIRRLRTIVRLAARRIGAAMVISIRAVTRITSRACARTASALPVPTIIVAPVRRRADARAAAAVLRATRITTSILVRQWLRPLTRTTRSAVRVISCWAIRRRSVGIDLWGEAEGGREVVPTSTLRFAIQTARKDSRFISRQRCTDAPGRLVLFGRFFPAQRFDIFMSLPIFNV